MNVVEMIYARLQACASFMLDGAVYFIIAMLGAFVKDIYDTYSGARPRIEIYRIFVGTMLSTFLTFAARDYVNSENLLPVVNFVLGVIGWELFVRISTIDGLVKTIRDGRQALVSLLSTNDPAPPRTNTHTAKTKVKEITKTDATTVETEIKKEKGD